MIFEMKIVVVVGARPNFMKAAPILKAIREFNGMRGEWAGHAQCAEEREDGQHHLRVTSAQEARNDRQLSLREVQRDVVSATRYGLL